MERPRFILDSLVADSAQDIIVAATRRGISIKSSQPVFSETSIVSGEFYDSPLSRVSLDNSYKYGFFDDNYPVAGDIHIITTGALKTSCAKVRHKDAFPIKFTTDSPVTINLITDNQGNTREYSSNDPLPEQVLGVVNDIYIVRDDNDGAVSSLSILILQP